MIEVQQTITDPKTGDCLRASFASILELPIENVPHYLGARDGTSQFIHYREWLASMNLTILCLNVPDRLPDGYCIVEVDLGETHHAVVAKDGEIIWDPAPGGLDSHYHIEGCIIFQLLDPSKPVTLPAAPDPVMSFEEFVGADFHRSEAH